jgi:integrase
MDTTADLMPLLASWKLAMQAERKAPYTIDSYVRGVRYYLDWCEEKDAVNTGDDRIFLDPLDRTTLQRWVTHLLDAGAEPATARIRQQAVRRFAAWLADPEQAEIDTDPFLGLKPPKIDAKVVSVLSADDLKLMVKACAGKELRDRRDEACLRLLAETGMRARGAAGAQHPRRGPGPGRQYRPQCVAGRNRQAVQECLLRPQEGRCPHRPNRRSGLAGPGQFPSRLLALQRTSTVVSSTTPFRAGIRAAMD